jgi:hypothetical protein
LIDVEAYVDSKGFASVGLEKRLQWTSLVYSDVAVSYGTGDDFDVESNLMYSPSWHWAIGASFAHKRLGAGVKLRF